MIIDASVLLQALFPDENQPNAQAVIRDHVAGRVHLAAPDLLFYELSNACLMANRRWRISPADAEAVLLAIEELGIATEPVSWRQILPLARRFERSAYDGAYLGLAESTGQPLVTGDIRLYHAVHPALDWVRWIGDYRTTE